MSLTLRFFPDEFCVCRLQTLEGVELSGEMFFLAKTRDELSLVCPAGEVPKNAGRIEVGWRAFRVEGPLDFALVGILSAITGVLADHAVSVFAVSTFDTDYILIKADQSDTAMAALGKAGYNIEVAEA